MLPWQPCSRAGSAGPVHLSKVEDEMKHWVWVCLLALVVGSAAACWAKSEVGVIDTDKVLSSYTAYQEASKKHEDFTAKRQAVLTVKFRMRLLTEAQTKECEELQKLAAPTAEQSKRLTDLLAASDTAEEELGQLKGKTGRSEAETKRMQELEALAETNAKVIEALQATLKKEVADELKRLMTPLEEKLKQTIAEVAGEMKLTVVLSKGDVLYGGEDITEKVLARLNKK